MTGISVRTSTMNDDARALFDAALAPQPAATALALPAACYVRPEFAAAERDMVFAKSWQFVCRAAQVAATGDHALAEIAGVPLIVARGADGQLRALHNVCRHRAGPVADCDGRGAAQFTCRYHGWRYALDGRLLGAPDMGRAQDFDAAAIRLPQARVAQWQGLVFAALDEGAPAFEELIAGIEARLGDTRLAGYQFDQRASYEVGCNWKVYVDNYLEGYHVPLVHPTLAPLLDADAYATTTARWSSLQASPLAASGPYAQGEALYWWLYPNTMLNVLPGRLQTNRVVPLAPNRCRVDFDYFYAPEVPAGRRIEDQRFSDDVQREDIAICEAVQRGLDSGSYVAGRLNPRQEAGLWHFHELLRAAYRSAPGATRQDLR
jgi:choline monooxygenase